MKKHHHKIRVRYADVDQMGVVYYANYLAFLESARTALLREEGFPYSQMEKEGLLLPVTECHIKYKGSARFEEELTIETTLGFIKNASIKINYTVRNETGAAIAVAHTVHPFVNTEWKIISVPDTIRAALSPYLAE